MENNVLIMKTHICKVLLFLFLNLGKFIPYFKRKYMALRKDSILGAINTQIKIHFRDKFGSMFEINDGVIVASNMNYHKIEFNILYDNSFNFDINLVYKDGLVSRKYVVTMTEESDDYILDFCKHFKSDTTNYNELFLALNTAI